jgi:hypothetical protein
MRHRAAFSLRRSLAEAVGFLPTAWSGAWLILLLLAGIGLLMPFLDHQIVIGVWPQWMQSAQVPLALLIKLIALGALYRLAVFRKAARIEGLGFGGLQFGRPELRLLAALLVMLIFLAVIAATFGLIFIIAFNLSPLGEGYADTMAAIMMVFSRAKGLDWLFILYAAAAGIVLILLMTRLSLMFAASVAERRLVTLNALALGEGNGLKLVIGVLVLLLPYPLAVLAGLRMPQDDGDALFLSYGVYSVATAFLILPLSVGFFASSYRQILANRSK